MNIYLMVLLGTGFTCLMTVLGSGLVFLFKNEIKPFFNQIFLGFAAGVMTAASVWSLLIPSIELSNGWIIPTLGFILGVIFIYIMDLVLPHFHPQSNEVEGMKSNFTKSTLLVLAVTLHNIPEGMAVGVAIASSLSGEVSSWPLAIAICLGMGLQNFPEGAAVSLPLKKSGMSSVKAFLMGSFSGVVEIFGGLLAAYLVGVVSNLMPWLLSFSAGAMMYVVVEELILEASLQKHSHLGTMSVLAGFVLMMVLDVALG